MECYKNVTLARPGESRLCSVAAIPRAAKNDDEAVPYLLIEDSGTRGLTGDPRADPELDLPARSGKTYRLFILHHQNARLLLHPPVHQHGSFIYDLGFRRDLITNKGLIETIDLLYWDPKRHRPKRGATTTTRPAA